MKGRSIGGVPKRGGRRCEPAAKRRVLIGPGDPASPWFRSHRRRKRLFFGSLVAHSAGVSARKILANIF